MKKILSSALAALIMISCLSTNLNAQTDYKPSPENLENREWFQEAKFGLFIHWGLYCILGGVAGEGLSEWIMHHQNIPIVQYEKLPAFFNPIDFNPAEWVSMVKKAGMKYITITSKHHEGFAMFDSKISDYNIVDATPYGKDVIRMLKDECDKQGIKLFFYHSQLDWHHPDYYPRGWTGKDIPGRPDSGDMDAYIDYMNAQLRELLTQYGEIGGIWFDGMWDKPDEKWRLEETYAMIHELQPGALIGSNHHKMPFPGEDFQMFERDLPGQNEMGWNEAGVSALPLEMCETMNGTWGFSILDQNYKSVRQLIHTMVKAAGHGSNFLLNTGPMPNGKIQPENVDTLMAIGKWMEMYGESIYGTRAGPVKPSEWGATTHKGNLVYMHVLDPELEKLSLPDFPSKVKSAKLFEDCSKVTYKQNKQGLTVTLPAWKPGCFDNIIVLELK